MKGFEVCKDGHRVTIDEKVREKLINKWSLDQESKSKLEKTKRTGMLELIDGHVTNIIKDIKDDTAKQIAKGTIEKVSRAIFESYDARYHLEPDLRKSQQIDVWLDEGDLNYYHTWNPFSIRLHNQIKDNVKDLMNRISISKEADLNFSIKNIRMSKLDRLFLYVW